MTTVGQLCVHCSPIPLDGSAPSATWALGPWKRVQGSDCPLCKVVLSAFYLLHRIAPGHDLETSTTSTDAIIYWASKVGPGRRGAFAIFPPLEGIWICKTGPFMEDNPDSQVEFLKPVIEAQLEISRLSTWISTCTIFHSGQCSSNEPAFRQVFPELPCLRLIDVQRGSLVELRSIPRYVTLSYVWGDSATIRLTNTNRRDLMKTGGIEKAWKKIPRTIRDAIQLVRKLGVRYLWVDVLCLIQNDPSDVASGINYMDEIFETSWLTIIAACGHNADSVLPGVQEGSRPRIVNATRITDDASFGIYIELDALLERTVYASRAWTYYNFYLKCSYARKANITPTIRFQEQLLARRSIYFVENQVYLRCREDIFSEQLVDRPHETPNASDSELRMSNIASFREPIADYIAILGHYTRRTLSDQNDILRALAGIIRRLEERLGCRFLQGLPTAVFDAFILFRRNNTGGVLRRRKCFPSYSWTGWKGQIELDRPGLTTLNKWLEEKTWIIWYEMSPSGELKLVWNSDSSLDDQKPYPAYGRRNPFHGQGGLLGNVDSVRTHPTQHLPPDIPVLEYPTLQFWTLSLRFKLWIKDIFSGTACIIGTQGDEVGMITLDGVEDTTIFECTEPLEFILLSAYSLINGPVELMNLQDAMTPKYHVLLLEWIGNVAERRGIGIIDQSAVVKGFAPGPEWKEILLG